MSNENAVKTVSGRVYKEAFLQAYSESNQTVENVRKIIFERTGILVPYGSFSVRKTLCKKEDLTAIADWLKEQTANTAENSPERSAAMATARKNAQKIELLYSMKRAKSERKKDGSILSILDIMDEMEFDDETTDNTSDE